jgi:hypothetical protein
LPTSKSGRLLVIVSVIPLLSALAFLVLFSSFLHLIRPPTLMSAEYVQAISVRAMSVTLSCYCIENQSYALALSTPTFLYCRCDLSSFLSLVSHDISFWGQLFKIRDTEVRVSSFKMVSSRATYSALQLPSSCTSKSLMCSLC